MKRYWFIKMSDSLKGSITPIHRAKLLRRALTVAALSEGWDKLVDMNVIAKDGSKWADYDADQHPDN